MKLCWELWAMLAFEARGPLNTDMLIYLTMGRGILNGLRVYTDLFESKPPGIFIMAAASLWLTDGTFLLRLLQGTILLFLPSALTVIAWRGRKCSNFQAVTHTAIAFMVGALLALRAEELSGGLQSEIFGLLPATLYALHLATPHRIAWKGALLNAVLIFWTVGVREPYILGLCAAALFSSRSPRDFVAKFLLPAILAALLGVIALTLLGALDIYVNTYLPAMLAQRIQAEFYGPLWLRVLRIHRFFAQLTTYSTVPLLGYCMAAFWLMNLLQGKILSRRLALATGIAAVLGVVGVNQYYVLLTVLHQAHALGLTTIQVLLDPGFWPITIAYAAGSLLFTSLLVFLGMSRRDVLWDLGCAVGGLLPLSMVVALSGYAWNYLLYVFPALVFLLQGFLRHDEKHPLPQYIVAGALCLAALTYEQVETKKLNLLLNAYPRLEENAAALDRLMEDCQVDRFGFFGQAPAFALSHHSPVGPIFSPYYHKYLGGKHPLYAQTALALRDTGILLKPAVLPDEANPLAADIEPLFTTEPPPCAANLRLLDGFTVLYRRKGARDDVEVR